MAVYKEEKNKYLACYLSLHRLERREKTKRKNEALRQSVKHSLGSGEQLNKLGGELRYDLQQLCRALCRRYDKQAERKQLGKPKSNIIRNKTLFHISEKLKKYIQKEYYQQRQKQLQTR